MRKRGFLWIAVGIGAWILDFVTYAFISIRLPMEFVGQISFLTLLVGWIALGFVGVGLTVIIADFLSWRRKKNNGRSS